MHNINLAIFNFINGGVGYYSTLDMFMLFLTTYLSYIVTIVVGLYVCLYIPLRTSAPMDRLRSLGQAGELIVATFFTWFVVQMIKVLVAHPRPFTTLMQINALVPGQTGYSFPSGHTALTVAVATVVYVYHKRLGQLLYAFAFVVALSRIYVGVHYPIDVLVGILIGIGIPVCIHKAFSPFRAQGVK